MYLKYSNIYWDSKKRNKLKINIKKYVGEFLLLIGFSLFWIFVFSNI